MNLKSGVTVFEALIAVLIISVLAYFSYPKYAEMWQASKANVLKEELRVFRDGITRYKAKTGDYPEKLMLLDEEGYIDFRGIMGEKFGIEYKKVDKEGYFLDPFGNRYDYNPETGKVHSQTEGYEEY